MIMQLEAMLINYFYEIQLDLKASYKIIAIIAKEHRFYDGTSFRNLTVDLYAFNKRRRMLFEGTNITHYQSHNKLYSKVVDS